MLAEASMKNLFNLIIGIFIGVIIAGVLYLTVRAPQGEPIELLPSPTPEPIIVYVSGAVKRPGVYRLPPEIRVVDAIQQAGGLLLDADLSQINLADKVVDGQQIVIPGGLDIPAPQLTIGGEGLLFTPTPPAGELINVNTASAEELDLLPGIGPTAAQKIVEYRLENGAFTRVEDLLKVAGIGPSTLEEIRGLITLGP
jgi:competence protein ComEA